jgi:hypothetical protein
MQTKQKNTKKKHVGQRTSIPRLNTDMSEKKKGNIARYSLFLKTEIRDR